MKCTYGGVKYHQNVIDVKSIDFHTGCVLLIRPRHATLLSAYFKDAGCVTNRAPQRMNYWG